MSEPKWRYKLREEAAGIGVTRSDSSRWSSADWETYVDEDTLLDALNTIPRSVDPLSVYLDFPRDVTCDGVEVTDVLESWQRTRQDGWGAVVTTPMPDSRPPLLQDVVRHAMDKIIVDTLTEGRPEGRKDDAHKRRMDLLPPRAIEAVADVLTFGAAKYGPDNWRRVEGRRWRYHAAALRHIFAWARGERCDPETGLHHIAHAVCCLLFILDEEVSGDA